MRLMKNPLTQFSDIDGRPLDAGYVFIGVPNDNPENSSVTVYWDALMTQPAAQPLRTVNGHISRSGKPAVMYIDEDYSILVRNRNRVLIYSEPFVQQVDNDIKSPWVASGVNPFYVSANSFTLQGDQTEEFHVGRRLQLFVGSGTVYGTIKTSAYTTFTEIELAMDAGQELDGGLNAINVSILRADHPATPNANIDQTIHGVLTFEDSPVVPDKFYFGAPEEVWWMARRIGEPFVLWDHITGVPVPPTNNPNFRFIKLTASDAYNSGVLTSESISGSAPRIAASAVVSLVGSPLNGRTVRLINTERRFIRAGNSGLLEDDMYQTHTHSSGYKAGAFNGNQVSIPWDVLGTQDGTTVTSASGGTETRPRNIGATVYMRIK